jgi:hypothetical protein
MILLGSSSSVPAQDGVERGQLPVAVSPGGQEGPSIASPCPTFSWVDEPTTLPLQLAVFDLGKEPRVPNATSAPLAAPAVIQESLPAGATSWTPPLRLCLKPGNRYAWSVASEVQESQRRWSEPRFFFVDPAGRRAWHQQSANSQHPPLQPTGSGGLAPNAGANLSSSATSTDPSGLHASASGPATEFGLVGIGNIADGAGLAAENTQGGADLILFGDDWLLRMTEAGIEVGAPLDVVYAIRNSDVGGTLTLLIDQVPALTTVTGALKTHTHEAPKEPD